MSAAGAIEQRADVSIGMADKPVGGLVYVQQGRREHSSFAYDESWLRDPNSFNISPDLRLATGYQHRRAPTPRDSVFPFALADTAPDAWGRRVIARDHAKRRRTDPSLRPLTEMDYLLAVDDFSRVGALRLPDRSGGQAQRGVEDGRRKTPPLLELPRILEASQAVERGQDTQEDLHYLLGKGTSLGGMRPKCTIIDGHGRLAIGKFPSVADERAVTRGEVLALHLAARAGIEAASASIVDIEGVAVALVHRFDRSHGHTRIPYLSAASMLQASREEDRSYVEIADAIRSHGSDPTHDLPQLWRRVAFNLLITNVDDHLQNHGFLYAGNGQWRLAPAFDLNPMPDRVRESKTWLSEEDGPVQDVATLLARCAHFSMTPLEALSVLGEILAALSDWREIARSPAVGLVDHELDDFALAFEHEQATAARSLIG